MHININLTEDIINQCLELHYCIQPAGKKLKQRLIWIPLFLVLLGVYLIYDELRQPAPGQNILMGVLYIGFAISYYIFMRHRLVKAGQRLVKRLGPNANFQIDIAGDQLTTTTANGRLTNNWSHFTSGLISKGNVLLYQSNNTFTMFNHTFFEEGDFERFKNMVRTNVQPVREV
jgi:hypothetical protein